MTIRGQLYFTIYTLNMKKKNAYILSQINKTLDIIIEGQCTDNTSLGTSSNYLKVKMTSNGYPKGAHVYVRVSGIEGNVVKGDSIEKL